MSTVAFARPEINFSERVEGLLQKTDYRLATTDEEKDRIYRLRYSAYLREGAIAPNFSNRLSDKYDDLDNAWVFGVYVGSHLAGSIRLNVASTAYPGFPAFETFRDVLESDLAAGKVIVDPTRFVIDHRFSRHYPDLRYATTRIAWMASEYFGADLLLASVRIEHQAFYKRVFGHDVVCDARPYHTLLKPLSLMACDYPMQRQPVNQRYPFFRSTHFERRMLFEHPDVPQEWSAEGTERKRASGTVDLAGRVAAFVG